MSVLLFYRRKGWKDDMAINMAVRDSHSGIRNIGNDTLVNASQYNRNHGVWVTSRYQIEPENFFKVSINKKLSGDFMRKTFQVVLYVREHAALRRIRIPFTGDAMATMACGYVEGNFDILTFKQLGPMGYTFKDIFERQFNFERTPELFDVSVIEPETKRLIIPSLEKVTTRSGRDITVPRIKSLRKINLKPRSD